MDLMRYVLSIAVIISHIDYLTGYNIPFPLSSFEAVGGFFAISGFLMYPNYLRHGNPKKYTIQRARRIIPPYLFIVIASALGFSLISGLSTSEYFLSKGFWAYLGANISFLNWLHPSLPDVFQGDAYVTSAVNGSLWTMKVEWCLYFSVPLFIWLTGKLKRIPPAWIAILIIVLSIAYRLLFTSLYISTGNEIYEILRRQIFGQLSFFYVGMLIYFIRDFISKHIASTVVSGIILMLIIPLTPTTVAIIIEPFAISALVIAISLFPYDIKILRHRNNISYEMYLFHFPIIQLGIYLGITSMGLTTTLVFSLVITAILALAVHVGMKRYVLPYGR